ncbi:MAG: uracil-DNA glycosylase [Candidatus Accumulibacter sp.]|nr:uracil-DNA glycosylase [Accumulibacter sp.]
MKLSRRKIFDEMGVSPYWVLRGAPEATVRFRKENTSFRDEMPESAEKRAPLPEMPVPDAAPESAAPMPRVPPTPPSPASSPEREDSRAGEIARMDWPQLRQSIAECRACGLCAKRKQAVPGVGDEHASWLFIGEGPGAEEDARGEPFVGQAGKLLDAMLDAIDLKRGENVYIANAVKCRPPGNRTPENAEMSICFPYLKRQIELISPKLIVLLGRAAVNSVLGIESALSSLRGKRLHYTEDEIEIPAIVTYHPAYLLRNLAEKAKAWEDMCRARELMNTLP